MLFVALHSLAVMSEIERCQNEMRQPSGEEPAFRGHGWCVAVLCDSCRILRDHCRVTGISEVPRDGHCESFKQAAEFRPSAHDLPQFHSSTVELGRTD